MSAAEPWNDPRTQDPGGEVSLAALLNILWRRWIFVIGFPLLGMVAGIVYSQVVTPLYEAQAIVRPGITGFGTRGGGFREWKLKDLSRWYAQRLYRSEVAQEMGIALWEVPKIRADFVMKGLQTTEGGNVLTLSILDPDPDRAARVLDTSIDAFAKYVLSDSTSNSLVLSEAGLLIQIEDKRREMEVVRNDARRLEIDLAIARRDSVLLDAHEENSHRLIDVMVAQKQRIEADLATFEVRAQRLIQQTEDINAAVEEARSALFPEGGRAELDPAVKPSAQLTETEVYRSLLETTVQLNDRLQGVRTRQDSLRAQLVNQEIEIQRAELGQKLDFDRQRREAGRQLEDLRLSLRSGVDLRLTELQLQIAEREAQIAALSAIERVGPITTSPKPVRPRKTRAIAILTFAGLLGGLTMAFVYEYVWNHRREIFSSRPPGSQSDAGSR